MADPQLINMSEQFKGLPMGQLIGSPLKAASDSQLKLAQSTADFIQSVGFEETEDENGKKSRKTREVQFSYTRKAPKGDEEGTLEEQKVDIQVPMLAIVNIPSLQIDNVDITFDMSINNVDSTATSSDEQFGLKGSAKVGYGPFSLEVEVSGSVSAHQEHTRKTDQTAKYHVGVQASQAGTPEGLSRVLDLMNQAVTPQPQSQTS